jgi:hypothetical protein
MVGWEEEGSNGLGMCVLSAPNGTERESRKGKGKGKLLKAFLSKPSVTVLEIH